VQFAIPACGSDCLFSCHRRGKTRFAPQRRAHKVRPDFVRAQGRPMQNFLFRKVELWFVALLILLSFLGFVFLASLVKSGAKQNVPDDKLTEAALAVASIPDTIRQLMTDTEPLAVTGKDRFDGARAGP
jgi:hypothetical protein